MRSGSSEAGGGMGTDGNPETGDASARDGTVDPDLARRRALNVIGHALWTPMATLVGEVEVLGEKHDEQTLAESLPRLKRSAHRVQRLIDDLLVASEIDTRLPTDAPAEFRLADVVSRARDEVELDGDVEVTGDTDCTVVASREAVRWALRHLVDNALRYGESPASVTLDCDDERARVEITSIGDPLPDNDLEHAFELCYRGEAAVMQAASGIGVGLTVARELATHLGGDLTLANRPDNRGVVAVLEFPARP